MASYRTKLIAGVAIAGSAVLITGGVTYALWSAQASVSGGVFTAGDLSLSYGEGTWQQTTEGIDSPAGGTLAGGADGFHSMPGDTIEVRVPLTTVLRGENLNALMKVEVGRAAASDIAAGRISATYRVDNAASEPASEEADLGTLVRVDGLEGSNSGVTAGWNVIVTVNVLGDYRWSEKDPILDLDSWAIDGLNVTLEQTRTGDGYTNGRSRS